MNSIRVTLLWLFLGVVAVGIHLAWWGWVVPPEVEMLKPQSGVARLSYLPIPSNKARILPAIWSPSFPAESIEGGELGLTGPPLEYKMDLVSFLPDTSLMAPAPRTETPSPLFERWLNRLDLPLPMPSVVPDPGPDLAGIHWRVEPEALADFIVVAALPNPRRSSWRAELMVGLAPETGLVKYVLLEHSSGIETLDRQLIRWAYGLEVPRQQDGLRMILWENGQ